MPDIPVASWICFMAAAFVFGYGAGHNAGSRR